MPRQTKGWTEGQKNGRTDGRTEGWAEPFSEDPYRGPNKASCERIIDKRLTIPIILLHLLILFWTCISKFSLSSITSPRCF